MQQLTAVGADQNVWNIVHSKAADGTITYAQAKEVSTVFFYWPNFWCFLKI